MRRKTQKVENHTYYILHKICIFVDISILFIPIYIFFQRLQYSFLYYAWEIIVTHMPIARQRLDKHFAKLHSQRTNEHAFLTTEDGVFREVRDDEL
jgi:hypothetical protein